MKAFFIRFLGCDRGATAVEYGLIAVLIAATIIASLTGVGRSVANAFESVNAALANLGL